MDVPRQGQTSPPEGQTVIGSDPPSAIRAARRKSRPASRPKPHKKGVLFNTSFKQNNFCCALLGFSGPRLRAAGPPPSCAGGLLPGAGASAPLWVRSGCVSGRGPCPARRRSGAWAGPRRRRAAPRRASATAAGRGPLDGAALRCRLPVVPPKIDTRPLTRPEIPAILDTAYRPRDASSTHGHQCSSTGGLFASQGGRILS